MRPLNPIAIAWLVCLAGCTTWVSEEDCVALEIVQMISRRTPRPHVLFVIVDSETPPAIREGIPRLVGSWLGGRLTTRGENTWGRPIELYVTSGDPESPIDHTRCSGEEAIVFQPRDRTDSPLRVEEEIRCRLRDIPTGDMRLFDVLGAHPMGRLSDDSTGPDEVLVVTGRDDASTNTWLLYGRAPALTLVARFPWSTSSCGSHAPTVPEALLAQIEFWSGSSAWADICEDFAMQLAVPFPEQVWDAGRLGCWPHAPEVRADGEQDCLLLAHLAPEWDASCEDTPGLTYHGVKGESVTCAVDQVPLARDTRLQEDGFYFVPRLPYCSLDPGFRLTPGARAATAWRLELRCTRPTDGNMCE